MNQKPRPPHFEPRSRVKLPYCLLAVLLVAALWLPAGSPPQYLSFQSTLVDANNSAISDGNYTIYFKIYDASQDGNLVWAESQLVTVNSGYFSVFLGQGSAIDGVETTASSLADAFKGADAGERYVGITVLDSSNTGTEISPRLQLLTSPYAFLATQATKLVDSDGNDILDASTGTITIPTGATAAGTLAVAGKLIAQDDVSVLGGLEVDNTLTITQLATAKAGIATTTLDASGAVSVNGGLTTTTLSASGNASIAGTLSSDGTVSVGDNIDMTGSGDKYLYGPSSTDDDNLIVHTGGQEFFRLDEKEDRITVKKLIKADGGITASGAVSADGVTTTTLTASGAVSANGVTTTTLTASGVVDAESGLTVEPQAGTEDSNRAVKYITLKNDNTAATSSIEDSSGKVLEWDIGLSTAERDGASKTHAGIAFIYDGDVKRIIKTDGDTKSLSDRRAKKDIEPIQNGVLEQIEMLSPVTFRYREQQADRGKSIGFIAQEVAEIYPELVSPMDKDRLGLSYRAFGVLSIAGIKELRREKDAEIQRLKNKNAELEKQLSAVLSRLQALESRID